MKVKTFLMITVMIVLQTLMSNGSFLTRNCLQPFKTKCLKRKCFDSDVTVKAKMTEAKTLIGTVDKLLKEDPESVEMLQKIHNESSLMEIVNIAHKDEITKDQMEFILSDDGQDKINEFKKKFADVVEAKSLIVKVAAKLKEHPEVVEMNTIINIALEDEITVDHIKFILSTGKEGPRKIKSILADGIPENNAVERKE